MAVVRPALDQLPTDVLWIITLQGLSLSDLSSLTQTCRLLHLFVEEFGWKAYAQVHAEPSPSLTPALEFSKWTIGDLLRHQTLARRAWKARKFITRPLGPEWSTKYRPVMAICSSRLVIAAGNSLFMYKFAPPMRQHAEQPQIKFEYIVTFPKDARRDFTGVSFVGQEDRDLLISYANGALARVQLPRSSDPARRRKLAVHAAAPTYFREYGHSIRSLSTTQTAFLTMDSAGVASMYSLRNPSPTLVSSVDLGTASPVRGWSAHLALQTRSGYAVLGTASPTPLLVHAVTESGLLPYPQAALSPSTGSIPVSSPTAVYSICGATPTFPLLSPCPQIVISGWYHGAIIVHDLRCPSQAARGGEHSTLSPALTMRDPVVLSPIYSVSAAGDRIAGGAAQHSLIHLHDVRSPKKGWSIYLPQPQHGYSTSSPVYSCLLESTRIWAATDSCALVVDFGRGYNEQTYPSLGHRRANTHSTGQTGWQTTFYEHDLFSRRPNGWRTGVVSTVA